MIESISDIHPGDRVRCSGGMSVPSGELVVIDLVTDDASGDKMIMVAQRREGGEVATVPPETVDHHEKYE